MNINARYRSKKLLFTLCTFYLLFSASQCEEVIGCGGFVKSNYSINYSRIDIKLYSKQGALKYETDCAPNTGYYLIPIYDKGDYILKIEPPSGWSFEPNSVDLHIDGKTDLCTRNQDINFNFKGFTIVGKVLSGGQEEGPSGVKLTLRTPSKEIIQETVSDVGGKYSFSSVHPGSYIIEADHNTWQFAKNTEAISVDQDNYESKSQIMISGFDVKGYVYSEGEPIQSVHFLLFADKKLKATPPDCRKDLVKGFSQDNKLQYICHVTSLKDGSFLFPSIPTGIYKLIPFHKGEHIEFDVSPSEVDFEVKQSSFEFSKHFQVEGFGVTGRVLETKNGKGVEGAEIFINDKHHTTAGKNGVYYLENMRAGVYDLKIQTPHIYFNVLSVKITPNTPQLPEIYASQFSICGHVQIRNYRGSSNPNKRNIAMKTSEGDFISNVSVQEDGAFCTVASPGSYIFEPILSEEEKNFGLQFDYPQRKVSVSHYPQLNVAFTQFLATIRGLVKCMGKCSGLTVKATSTTDEDYFLETTTLDDGKIFIEGCLPGKYILTIEKDSWCFLSKKLDFVVVDKDVSDLVFVQTGFQASVRMSHPSSFKIKYPSGEMHSLFLEKGKNVLCLPESGVHELVPVGCHLYKSNTFKLDTNKPSEINIESSKHLVTGSVLTEVNVSDIRVSIHRHSSSAPEIIPLKEPVELKEKVYRYVFSVFVEPNTELEVRVTSSELLFQPAVAAISVQDDCIDGAVEVIGKTGLFIDGVIVPPLQGVQMRVFNKMSKVKLAEIVTDVEGRCRFGPLDSDFEYEVTAEKEGYFFTAQQIVGKFQAFKLAEIVVDVNTEGGVPLSGVLLSLSGGIDYRKNSLSQKNGKVTFIGLNPGQYFLRPMLKEFQFQPPTKMIDIKEGTQVKVQISGKRVAFSLFGVVNSLTGEAEVGVSVEAVGLESQHCLQYQEEAITEQGGTFRIRGLQPGCQYSLRLKKGQDVNQHIERATPEETFIKVSDSDITNVRIIAFRHFSQMDVSGSITTSQEYLQTLKVRLYCDDNPEQVLQTINMGRSSFFFLPSMPIDKRTYTLKVESSLSSSSYAYDSPSVTFCANKSFHHFTFSFHPKQKSQEQEVTQGSILALPVAIIAIILVYYREKFFAFILQMWQTSSAVLLNSKSSLSTDNTTNEGPSTRRKLKARRIL